MVLLPFIFCNHNILMIIQIFTEKQFCYKFWTADTLTMVTIYFFAYK